MKITHSNYTITGHKEHVRVYCEICKRNIKLDKDYQKTTDTTMKTVENDKSLKEHDLSPLHVRRIKQLKKNIKFVDKGWALITISGQDVETLDTDKNSTVLLDNQINHFTKYLYRFVQGANFRIFSEQQGSYIRRLNKYRKNLDRVTNIEKRFNDKPLIDNFTDFRKENALSMSNVPLTKHDDGRFWETRQWYRDMEQDSIHILVKHDKSLLLLSRLEEFKEDLALIGMDVIYNDDPVGMYKTIMLGLDMYDEMSMNPFMKDSGKYTEITSEPYNVTTDSRYKSTKFSKIIYADNIMTTDKRLNVGWLYDLLTAYGDNIKIAVEGNTMSSVAQDQYLKTLKYKIEKESGLSRNMSKKDLKKQAQLEKLSEMGIDDRELTERDYQLYYNSLSGKDNILTNISISAIVSGNTKADVEKSINVFSKRVMERYNIRFARVEGSQNEMIAESLGVTRKPFVNLTIPLNYIAMGQPYTAISINEPMGHVVGNSIITGSPVVINNWSFGIDKNVNIKQKIDTYGAEYSKVDWNTQSMNGNVVIIGKSGSGKSSFLSTLILQDLITHREVIVLDVEGEYTKKAFDLGQTVYDFGTSPIKHNGKTLPKSGINPLEIFNLENMDEEEMKQRIAIKLDFLKNWLTTINPMFIGGVVELGEILNKVDELYKAHLPKYVDGSKPWPTFQKLTESYYAMIVDNEEDVEFPMDRIRSIRRSLSNFRVAKPAIYELLFTILKEGTLAFEMFGKQSSLSNDASQQMIVLNTKGQSLEQDDVNYAKKALFLLLMQWVKERAMSGRYNDTWLDGTPKSMMFVLDEAHKYLSAGDPVFYEFIVDLFKRLRKRNCGITIATQDIHDIVSPGEQQSKILNNVSTFYIGSTSGKIDDVLNTFEAGLSNKTPQIIKDTFEQEIKSGNTISRGKFLVKRGNKLDIINVFIPHYADSFASRGYKLEEKYSHVVDISMSGKGTDIDKKQILMFAYIGELILNIAQNNGLVDITMADIDALIVADKLSLTQIVEKILPEYLWLETLTAIQKLTADKAVSKAVDAMSMEIGNGFVKPINEMNEKRYYFDELFKD